jgi:hypothetical protein
VIAYGWLAWLLLFLCYEIPAAIAEVIYDRRGTPRAITLSRNVWRWVGLAEGQQWRPYRRLRQAALFVFLQVLAFHLPFGTPGGAWVIATSIPVAGVIAYAVFVEDRRARLQVALRIDASSFTRDCASLLAAIDRVNHAERRRAAKVEALRMSEIARAEADLAEQIRADTKGGQ